MNIRLLLFTLLFSISLQTVSQEKNEQLYYFIKVWGLLKYFHPDIQKGKIDWNDAFLKEADVLLSTNTGNTAIHDLIKMTGKVNTNAHGLYRKYKNSPYANLNFAWIDDPSLNIEQEEKNFLKQVIEKFVPGPNAYIKKEINKYYLNSPAEKFWYPSDYIPDSLNSFLALAKFWNIINYFDPHKNLFDQTWDKTLKDFIPLVLKTASQKEIYRTFASLAVKIDDGHAIYNNYEFDSLMGLHRPGLSVTLFEDRYNVVTFISDSLKLKTGIATGDIITRINGVDVAARRKELEKYCRASTTKATQRNIDAELLKGNYGRSYEIVFVNAKNEQRKTTFTFTKGLAMPSNIRYENPVRSFPELNAHYIRLSAGDQGPLKDIVKHADQPGRYLILDLRSGAVNINWNWLNNIFIRSKIHFATYYDCSFDYPGYFKKKEMYAPSLLSPFSKKFSGKLIILINEKIQSSPEFNLMKWKAAIPGIVFIGRNTAGADGAATSVLIQDNVLTYFTRDVVLFPNGQQTQRIGIAPDIYTEDSLALFREGKDAILERTLEYIRTGK